MAAACAAHPPRGGAEAEITLSSQSSPDLALALMRGKLDVAFLRPETQTIGLTFRSLTKEPLIAVLPADHRLTARKRIAPQDLAREIYVSSARLSPVLKSVIADYAAAIGITLKASTKARTSPTAMSLVASTGGVTLIPLYAQNVLTPNVVARALEGTAPTIDLMLGYNEPTHRLCSGDFLRAPTSWSPTCKSRAFFGTSPSSRPSGTAGQPR